MYNSEPWPDVRHEMLDMAKQKVPTMRLYIVSDNYREVYPGDFHENFGYPFGVIMPSDM